MPATKGWSLEAGEVLARRIAAEVESELSSLAALEAELAGAPQSDDTYALRARGSILHDFYNRVERVFVRIARELNGGVPRAEQWHRELIRNMALDIPAVRPAVIDAELAGTLEEYLRSPARLPQRLRGGAERQAHAVARGANAADSRCIPRSNAGVPRLDAGERMTDAPAAADFK